MIIWLAKSVIDSAIGIDESTPADTPDANLHMMSASAKVWLIKTGNLQLRTLYYPVVAKQIRATTQQDFY